MPILIIKSKGQDHICYYDPQDRELITRYNWSLNSQGYAVTQKNGKSVLMHRLILDVNDPKIYCDHINHNGLDNRRTNLRICTRSENQHNRRKQKSTCAYKGVTRFAGKYFAQIRCNNEYLYLGLFRNERTAGRVYDTAARRLHGSFALHNNLEPLPQQLQLPI